MIVTRFAPSPNGSLHLGHAWSAIVAHDLARAAEGEFLVRIEDIDAARSRPGLIAEIFADLDWLGLRHDGAVVVQSEQTARYAEAGDVLRAMGVLYPCRCTRADIIATASRHGPDGPIYPGTCRARDVDPSGRCVAARYGAGNGNRRPAGVGGCTGRAPGRGAGDVR